MPAQPPPEVIRVSTLQVACDGSGEVAPVLGHPRVYLRIEEDTGFASGRSLHEDRIATIRSVKSRFGEVIDPHTADGVKIATYCKEHPNSGLLEAAERALGRVE